MKLTSKILDRLIREEIDKAERSQKKDIVEPAPDPSKFINVDGEREKYTEVQRVYVDLIATLDQDQLRILKKAFCHDSYTTQDLQDIAAAMKGKLNDQPKNK
tara:strand:- start:110 stop:415 length:306 start_codon:yes stop_codon:yes gene_type:complete